MTLIKQELFVRGMNLVEKWCQANDVEVPLVIENEEPKQFGVCAFYRSGVIKICLEACARPGMQGREWSYLGYTVDREPAGVLVHELGHHVDKAHGRAGGLRSHKLRAETGEEPISGYCPNDNEWFAEMFRLFVTNPSLLVSLRPKTYAALNQEFPHLVETRHWRDVLAEVPRQLKAAENKVRAVLREEGKRARRPVIRVTMEVG